MEEVRFPNGVKVRATALADRELNKEWRTVGLYLDPRWTPTWPACVIDWPDFGLPADWKFAANQIKLAFDMAASGGCVEIGCAGGLGRTGTVLACMAILSGVPSDTAVDWVRQNYDPRAIETEEQVQWVKWFGRNAPDNLETE